ncbi:MAG: 2OG-Fe dioxygenase family protein [Betaproteobacteria bacterium]|nr:2OG-Fe dioxygenase family protein [Betaproteobacteria bacterium]
MLVIPPDYSQADHFVQDICQQGYAVLSPHDTLQLTGNAAAELAALADSWDRLPADHYLRDGGHYRRRRHSCFILNGSAIEQTPHRFHWQPLEYNALHGGIRRMFEPIEADTIAQPAWNRLLRGVGAVCDALRGQQPWYVEAHQFRIDTTDGIGRPTPEGAHRDGVDFVAILLVDRHNVIGGESRIFEAGSSVGKRFTLLEDWTLLLLDDVRMIHESTPIQPQGESAHRDTLVLTLRRGGFQTEQDIPSAGPTARQTV